MMLKDLFAKPFPNEREFQVSCTEFMYQTLFMTDFWTTHVFHKQHCLKNE